MPTRTQQSDILLAAYASHGDTRHPLLLPASPKECFEMTAQAFDLSERLQTPVIIMTDLDLGMNDHVTDPLAWDDSKVYDRGKLLNAKQLDRIYKTVTNGNGTPLPTNGNRGAVEGIDDIEAFDHPEEGRHDQGGAEMEQFEGKYGRYLDLDGDGIPYRTIPGVHATRGAFVTRGSSRDEYAVYTEDAEAYRRNVDRLMRKWETAKELVPGPVFYRGDGRRDPGSEIHDTSPRDGVIFFGTSTYSAEEAIDMLADEGINLDAMRPRAFPFGKAFSDFVQSHDRIFVIEQNRDSQFRSLMMIELNIDPAKLISVLNYDGMPITADHIYLKIKSQVTGR
jgi:2-oxoglutarate ferredoxin oxidoreductase subunit alpha